MRSHNPRLARAVLAGLPAFAAANAAAQPTTYAVDFVSTAADGLAMNDRGMIAGVQFRIPAGCTPSTCAPVRQVVVWSPEDSVTPLPLLPGFSTVTPVGINDDGWVAGYAGDAPFGAARAVVWKPSATGYTAIDLGVLPGHASSWAAGIDDQERAVGWSTTGGAIPTSTAPLVWTEATGLVNLAAQGFPNDLPLAVSPGGAVATPDFWYRLGDPSSVRRLAPPPDGFRGPGNFPAAINDSGDQARFLTSTSANNLPFLFRYHADTETWQRIWPGGAGHLAPFGIGGINAAGDITATVGGVGLIAYGPDGLAEPLSLRLSPAYGGGAALNVVPEAGPINDEGVIAAQVILGRSPRLVRVVPAERCTAACIRVASIQMTGRMTGFPRGQCTPNARNQVTARVAVTDPAGAPQPNATVHAIFLDDYYLERPVTGTTGRRGNARFAHSGPACVGAIAILVQDVDRNGRQLDVTTGQLTDYVIPQP